MENYKDIVIQALFFNCTNISPAYNGGLRIGFKNAALAHIFLERLDKLNINYNSGVAYVTAEIAEAFLVIKLF